MLADKSVNHTRYNTDDVNDLLEAINDTVVFFNTTDYRGNAQSVKLNTNVSDIQSLNYVSLNALESRGNSYGRRRRHSSRGEISASTHATLRIANPKVIAEHSEYQLAMLGAMSGEHPVLPVEVVKDVVKTILRSRSRWQHDSNTEPLILQVAEQLSASHRIRIESSIQSGADARKPLTKEEKIERLQSDSFYGQGGQLEGPRWGYRCGYRAATGQWKYRIREAQRYYDTERDHRAQYAVKLKDLGVEPVPYETFSQFLRRMADEIEGGRR